MEARNIYFLGIGGIGMSALARYFHLKGMQVSGYDKTRSVVTEALENEGIKVWYELDPRHLKAQERVIYTPAISEDNVELAAARKVLPVQKRSQVLGEISRDYRVIAVAGTHGKTSTSVLMTHVFRDSGLDATAFLGGISRNLRSNFAFGASDLMIVEADEYDRSFLTLHPSLAIVNSVDPDHLDIYGTKEKMWEGFREFAGQVKADGDLLVHETLAQLDWGREVLSFGQGDADYRAENIRFEGLATIFDFVSSEGRIENIRLRMPGVHNVMNALAALSSATLMKADRAMLKPALESFEGIYRRYEVHVDGKEVSYVDDYAHHPAEIDAAIATARGLFPERQVLVIFQPHLFSRTRDFCDGFARALNAADALIMLDIYPARELPMEGVSSQMILNRMKGIPAQLSGKNKLVQSITEMIKPPSILLSLGAGDIDREILKIKKLALKLNN